MLSASRMALSAMCRNSQTVLLKPQMTRNFTGRTRLERIAEKRMGLKGAIAQPRATPAQAGGWTAFEIGKGCVAGGSILGLGALCYYGLTFDATSVRAQSIAWPQYVRDRVRATYAYYGGGLAVTAAAAAAVYRIPAVLNMLTNIPAVLACTALVFGSHMLLVSLPYGPGLNSKKIAWVGHSALIGAMIAPMCFLGGPLLLRAAWYTAGVVGSLSAVAVCAPSDKFMNMGGPLAIGFGAVFASSIGTYFLPPTTALGASVYSIAMYGGVLLFSALFLSNTQRIMHNAQQHPPYGVAPYDPINSAASIHASTINIFIRIAMMLSGNRSK